MKSEQTAHATFNHGGTMPAPDTTFAQLPVSPPPDPAWDDACLRVESYLRAHHLESRLLLNKLAAEIIVEARTRAAARPAEQPVALAMQITYARIAAWFARAAEQSDRPGERDRAHARLALVIANRPGCLSNYFLSEQAVPPEFTAAMAAFQFQPGPELRFSNMPTAPLTFGFDDPDNSQSAQNGAGGFARAASSWLLVVGLIGVAWAAGH